MRITANVRRAPLRLTTGAFVLNSGVSTFNANEEKIQRLHASAVSVLPQVARLKPRTFAKALAAGEVTLGTALMLPIVPPAIAGLGLSAFAASLLAARQPASAQQAAAPGETSSAVPGATEAWMLGSGVSLVLDALTTPAHDKKVELSARMQEKAAAKRRHLRRSRRKAAALAASAQLGDKARDAGDRLSDASGRVAERASELRDEYQPVAAKKLKKAKKRARKQAEQAAATARASAEGLSERLQQVAS